MVQHLPDSGDAQFQVVRAGEFKPSKPISLKSPYAYPVEGRPHSNLMAELRWYLEEFLGYPYPPETDHAGYSLYCLWY